MICHTLTNTVWRCPYGTAVITGLCTSEWRDDSQEIVGSSTFRRFESVSNGALSHSGQYSTRNGTHNSQAEGRL